MGIFKRVRDIAVANVNEALDKLECPVSMIKQYMRDLEGEIASAEGAVARQIAMEKRQERLLAETEDFIAKRTRQAQLAIDTGEDNIAKLALQDKLAYEAKLATYREQYNTIKGHTVQLVEQLKELKEKYTELQQKKTVLISRANVARSTEQINLSLASIDTESATRGFARMEDRILEMEAKAEASQRIRSLSTTATASALQEREFAADVEQEFEKLKASKSEVVTTEA
jgi:phage shock protein A